MRNNTRRLESAGGARAGVCLPANGAGAQHGLLRDQPENLLQVFQNAPRNDEAHGRTEDVSVPEHAAQRRGVGQHAGVPGGEDVI